MSDNRITLRMTDEDTVNLDHIKAHLDLVSDSEAIRKALAITAATISVAAAPQANLEQYHEWKYEDFPVSDYHTGSEHRDSAGRLWLLTENSSGLPMWKCVNHGHRL